MVHYKDRLAEAMKNAEIGPTALATRLGVSYQAVKKVLDGSTRAFTAANNARAASALKVNPNWLATGQGDRDEVGAPMSSAQVSTGPSARLLVEQLVAIALPHRATLRKNLASLLVDLLEHPEDADLIEQTIADIERFYK